MPQAPLCSLLSLCCSLLRLLLLLRLRASLLVQLLHQLLAGWVQLERSICCQSAASSGACCASINPHEAQSILQHAC